jgi:hypothetical protein
MALRFTPSDPDNCLVYVIRDHDYWTGLSKRRTTVILTPMELKFPKFPSNHADLPFIFANQVLSITDQVYALWELRPASYNLSVFFMNEYFGLLLGQMETLPPKSSPMAQVKFECNSGEVLFYAVSDRGFSHNVELNKMNPEAGAEYVRNSLRAVGYFDTENPGYRDCQGKW